MTEGVEIAVIAAVPGLFATGGTIVTVLLARSNAKKADAIHVLVNSQLTNLKDQLFAARKEIEDLKALLSEYGKGL